jgi:hypothetical protein
MALSKNDILDIDDIKTKEIEVPEWDGSVFIRQLTRGQADEYFGRRFAKSELKQRGRNQSEVESDVKLFGHDAWLVAQAVCDENGQRLFSNADVKELEKKNSNAIGRIAVAIVDFSGMGQDVEELDELKN